MFHSGLHSVYQWVKGMCSAVICITFLEHNALAYDCVKCTLNVTKVSVGNEMILYPYGIYMNVKQDHMYST